MKKWLNTIESVVADLRKGRMAIVVDDEDRENEGDLIMAGEWATPKAVNFMARFGRGLICVPTTSERLKQLGIEQMVVKNRESFKTDFQVSVDAAQCPKCGSSEPKAKVVSLPECFLCKNPVYAHPGGSNGDNSNGDHSVNLNHDNENGLKTRGGWWIHDRCAT